MYGRKEPGTPGRKTPIDPTKDKKAFFADNIVDPNDHDDFDVNQYYYQRNEGEHFPPTSTIQPSQKINPIQNPIAVGNNDFSHNYVPSQGSGNISYQNMHMNQGIQNSYINQDMMRTSQGSQIHPRYIGNQQEYINSIGRVQTDKNVDSNLVQNNHPYNMMSNMHSSRQNVNLSGPGGQVVQMRYDYNGGNNQQPIMYDMMSKINLNGQVHPIENNFQNMTQNNRKPVFSTSSEVQEFQIQNERDFPALTKESGSQETQPISSDVNTYPNTSQSRIQVNRPQGINHGSQPTTHQGEKGNFAPDTYDLTYLLNISRMADKSLYTLSIGTDLTTTLGMDLKTEDVLYPKFVSPWTSLEDDYKIPPCYSIPELNLPTPKQMEKFSDETLFTIFYSMPKDVLQIFAAQQLSSRKWMYHKVEKKWYQRAMNGIQSSTPSFEIGTYSCFDPDRWEVKTKDNYKLEYDKIYA